ncbi:MAG: ABC transporter permease [Acidimicrobiales bacterium]|jgi:simple sugar transport system permease protein
MSDVATETPRSSQLLKIALRVRRANMALVLALALFVGLTIGAVMIIVTTPALVHSWSTFFSHPGATISQNFNTVWFAYEQIFQGSLFNFHAMRLLIDHPDKANLASALGPISLTLQDATPLIVAGLGLAIGFRSNLFDIGGQGQVIVGGLVAGLIGFSLNLTPILQVSLELVGAMIAGALLASLAGVLKAYTGAHEVIVTMMCNYIMLLLLGYLLITNLFARPGVRDGASKAVTPTGQLPYFFSHLSSGLLVNVGFLIALAMVFVVQWFFQRSKTGFELLMVGQNGEAARTAGINAKRTTIITLCLAGAFCGLAGMLELTGVDHFLSPNFGGSYGFDAITVALLGRNRPWGVFFGAIFFGAMYAGGEAMQAFTPTNIQYSLAQVIQAVVVFCVATPALIVEIFRLTDNGRFRSSGSSGSWTK